MSFDSNEYIQNYEIYPSSYAIAQVDIEKNSNCIQAEDIEELYMAKDRLRNFASQIGSEKYTPLRDDVLDHCDRIKAMKNQSLNYDKLEKMVKNRIQKMIKNKRIKKNWSEQDILILIWIISKYADFKKIRHIERDLTQSNWDQISQLIPGVEGENCMFKWLSLKKNKLSDYAWSDKESLILNKLVKQKINLNNKNQQPDWGWVSQQLYYLNNNSSKVYRCPKQCRQHWNCYLNPHLKKGPWSQQQDLILLSEIKSKNGLKKWADMIKLFNGRTQNALKNRFNLIIEKEKHAQYKNKNLSELELVNSYLQKNYITQFVGKKIGSQLQTKKQREIEDNKDEPFKQIKIQSKQSIQSQPKRVLRNRTRAKKCVEVEPIPEKSYDSYFCQKFEPFITTPIKVIGTKIQNEAWEFNPIQLTPVITISEFQNKYLSDVQNFHTPQGIPLSFPQAVKIQDDDKIHEDQSIKYMNLTPKSKDSVILPDLQKIKIVPVKQNDMLRIKQLLFGLSKGELKECSFVPCQISQNRLTKFNC